MNFKIDIFDNTNQTTASLYKEFVQKINQDEEIFRTITRKKIHPNWKVFKRYQLEWITLGGIFYLNITMYETIDLATKKHKRFVYYHHSKIKEISKTKYDIDCIKLAIKFYLESIPVPNHLKKLLPSKQLTKFYTKKFGIFDQIQQENLKKLEQLERDFKQTDEQIYIEMDDLYINHQAEKKKKMRVREVVFHTQNNKKLENVLNLFFTKNLDEKLNEFNDIEFIFKTLKEVMKRTKNSKKMVVSGDGARWIKRLTERLNLEFSLDLFHIKKALNLAFGFNKYAPKENKKLFKNWYNLTLNLSWKEAFEYAILTKNISLFKQIYKEFLVESETKIVSKTILLNAKNFYKLIINNSKYVFNNDQNYSSFTEHFVYNSFKKHIKKSQSLYSFDTIKMKVIYQNLLKEQITIFL
ncbi:CDS22, conserved hypothetical protein (part of ICE) [Mycoplasma mycoides subsp. capri LC str. 95010]|uniref:Uncharacterized protein n=1 Tax=Mycoplasma mycoides subsp. capri LC str. 95010 TaxID=862259 RepID=F4MPC4_MYCML|nr:hypothetical protein [Mycoplasma mycoides]CBW53956.1 CDS22, conserved hypothetical protein (part of ICE) [Mycoplasma mycoides subsp. capri LC str. 95010]CBW54017.1 CDS22, conserved hypothetical protein (part of ICE) [Mycoplasma mycoides subsp. capri LC str. 95010]